MDDDPAAAWRGLDVWLQGVPDEPSVASVRFDTGPPGEMTVEAAIDMFIISDVLVHTWDLARTGHLDETLDATVVREMLGGLEPLVDRARRDSGHYGPRVEVPDDAYDQAKLIALTGRRP